MSKSILNPELLKLAHDQASRVKSGFVDAATAQGAVPPTGAAGGPAMPPTGAAGGPAMPPTGAAGGPAMPAGGGDPLTALQPMIQQAVSEAMASQGGGAGGAAGGPGEKPKMKVDVNQEIYQIKKLLVMMAEEMNLPVPATMLLGDPAQDPNSPPGQAESDPMSAGYDPSTQQSAIPPIEPLGAAAPGMGQEEGQKAAVAQDEKIHRGVAFAAPATSDIARNTNTAHALLAQLNAR